MENINFTFDGNYLVVELNRNQDVVNYQMEMLTHNKINYLLPVKKQTVNNSIYLYYEMTEGMSLERLVMHKKLSDKAYYEFVKGTLCAVKEIGEYQLYPSGIVLDGHYIFVNPIEFTPYFVYLPIKNNQDGMANIIDFLKNMMVSNMIDIKNAGVMQKIINVLNSEKSVNEMISELRNAGGFDGAASMGDARAVHAAAVAEMNRAPQPVSFGTPVDNNVLSSAPVREEKEEKKQIKQATPISQNRNIPKNINISGGTAIPKKNVAPGKPTNVEKKEKNKENIQAGEPDMNKIRPILIGVGAVILILFAVLFTSGTFTDENGNNDYMVLVAVPILIGAADYFIYSKLKTKFVISADAAVNQTEVEVQPAKKIKKPQKEVVMPVVEVKTTVNESYNAPQNHEFAAAQNNVPAGFSYPGANVSFVESDKTEILTGDELIQPYLQGRGGNRIVLNAQITRIGKLKDQADVIIRNPKVSRVHADIILRNGKIYVVDLGSANGTYINGASDRITSNMEYELHNNDIVVFANEEYTVYC